MSISNTKTASFNYLTVWSLALSGKSEITETKSSALGGKAAFERIRADGGNATNPADVLRELLQTHGACLILIDA